MLDNLRVDVQSTALLIKILCLVKHAVFYVNISLQALVSSNSQVARTFSTNSLIALVTSDAHLDKTVMKPYKRACIKGIDSTLLGYLSVLAN